MAYRHPISSRVGDLTIEARFDPDPWWLKIKGASGTILTLDPDATRELRDALTRIIDAQNIETLRDIHAKG